jgi:hypothetical protein
LVSQPKPKPKPQRGRPQRSSKPVASCHGRCCGCSSSSSGSWGSDGAGDAAVCAMRQCVRCDAMR